MSVFGKSSFDVFTILLLKTGVASECTLVLGQPEVHLQAEMRGERANPWLPPIDSNKDILARLNLDLKKDPVLLHNSFYSVVISFSQGKFYFKYLLRFKYSNGFKTMFTPYDTMSYKRLTSVRWKQITTKHSIWCIVNLLKFKYRNSDPKGFLVNPV